MDIISFVLAASILVALGVGVILFLAWCAPEYPYDGRP
jgi:hypothetical protein